MSIQIDLILSYVTFQLNNFCSFCFLQLIQDGTPNYIPVVERISVLSLRTIHLNTSCLENLGPRKNHTHTHAHTK